MAVLNVFVACPYQIFPLEDYKRAFDNVSKQYSVGFKFADEQITNQHILAKVSNYIRDQDLSLFDITGWNPNVALELGIAVGMSKKYFILLNTHLDKNKEAPSDIRGIERIQYASNAELEAKLTFLVKQELSTASDRSESAFTSVKTRIIEALHENPGIGLSKLADCVKEEKSIVQSVVRALIQSEELKTQGQKKGTVYFTADTDMRTVKRPK